MLALRTSPPSLRPAEAERIARDLYGLAVTISALPGERDCNFRLRTADAPGVDAPAAATREFVLKVHDVAVDAESTDCLVSVLDHLAEQDPTLPVPRLFPTQQGDAVGRISSEGVDYSTCLVSFLPGRLLAALPPSTLLLQNLGATLARVDRALQGFFHPSLTRRLAWDVRHLPELAQFSRYIESAALRDTVDRVSNAFRACLPRLRGLRSQAIHGDCHAGNGRARRQRSDRRGEADFDRLAQCLGIVFGLAFAARLDRRRPARRAQMLATNIERQNPGRLRAEVDTQ